MCLSSIEVADFEPHQADEVVRLWRASFEHGVGILDPNPIEQQLRAFVEEVVPSNRVRVALQGPTVVYTFARNANARRFNERHGFHEVERESGNMWKLEAIKYEWFRSRGANAR